MIEKMERVLEDRLQDRNEPLQKRLQGKPNVGKSALRPLSHPWRPCFPGAFQFQEHLQMAAKGASFPLRH